MEFVKNGGTHDTEYAGGPVAKGFKFYKKEKAIFHAIYIPHGETLIGCSVPVTGFGPKSIPKKFCLRT